MKVKSNNDSCKRLAARRRWVYVVTSLLIIIIVTVAFVYLIPHQSGPPKAAIVDQLSSLQLDPLSRHPNPAFVNRTMELLYTRFAEVDYYSDNATVDNYGFLTSYRFIVWRAHSALDLASNFTAICTSENDTSGSYDQYLQNRQLTLCKIEGDPTHYLAITPSFVKEVMSGRFEDTVIVFMSCNGLKQGYNKTAESFADKGVKAFISWDGWVDMSDNDNAISALLEYLIGESDTIAQAVGRMPSYSSSLYGNCTLRYYPPEAADYEIPNYKQSGVTGNVVLGLATMSRRVKPARRLSPD
jgi:hypothetical protein